ncbi:hypothetical protein ACYEXS_34600 [Paenibacillus sp. MAH-36]|uniref:Uncharacterized protein n=1 Tax=Paenibacillus violae TaxID=3077234 RepID=A0ABU3RNG9_9BACL|nr:hypothetical protein [Paenibacillus sp. PFR10]MDU0205830.1 hypothetical protein [Paenibacillus sp. PFR10]
MIRQKGLELSNFINNINGCYIQSTNEDKQHMFKTRGEVVWSNRGKQQWGGIHFGENVLKIRIDYPKGKFDLDFFKENLDLPEINYEDYGVSGVRKVITTKNPPFDSIDVILYPNKLKEYVLLTSKCKDVLQEIVSASCRY